MFTKQNKAGKTGKTKRTNLKKKTDTIFKNKTDKTGVCVCARACARMCGARRSGVTGEWWSGGGGLSPA